MAFSDEQVMLTLAGVAHRGFHDVLHDEQHDLRVRGAVQAGLDELVPVRGEWTLVWGPVTSHGARELVDTNAMYVVRHAREPTRYVVALRGTNPASLSDWVFGDFWVNAVVPWPYAEAGARVAISASTALGLAALQTMRSRPTGQTATGLVASAIARAGGLLRRVGEAASGLPRAPLAILRGQLNNQVTRMVASWQDTAVRAGRLRADGGGAREVRPLPTVFRPRPLPVPRPDAELDLMMFLGAEAARASAPLDVTVTGFSKGAALAQTVALWLHEALDVPDERWDAGRGARVRCHVFAGPTPGNAAFARRFEERLGADHHHVRNTHDLVTHAWQVDDLRRIPGMYGARTAIFRPVIESIVSGTEALAYRHVQTGTRLIEGVLVPSRPFAEEFVYQHLDGYVDQLGLRAAGVDALKFFF